ncbi:MAG: glycosyltransferase family 4 protein, partial [Actinomycetota bacterium]
MTSVDPPTASPASGDREEGAAGAEPGRWPVPKSNSVVIPVVERESYLPARAEGSAARIVLVSPLEPDAGPAQATMIFGLLERGWDAHLVLEDTSPGGQARPPAVDIRALARRLHVARPTTRRLRRSRDLDAVVRALDPQVVHFLRADHARSLVGLASETAPGVAATFSAADVNVAGLDVPDYYRPLWERADVLHFPDAAVLSRALRRGLPPSKPREVIPPFVDPGAFHPNGRRPQAERPLRVLCAGPLEWAGGYEHGLQALALALAREQGAAWECRVVGDGAHLSALLFARHQLGLGDSVSFEAATTPEGLREHMSWADVFLAPTVVDGLPDHVIEASAMALCLVMADPGPLGELELGESVAMNVPRRAPGALTEALATVAADAGRRARMG